MLEKIYDLLFREKYFLLIYAALGFVYIIKLESLYLRFIQSWILVTAFEALIVFIFLGLKKKGERKNVITNARKE